MMRESLFDARDIDLPSLIPREVLFGNADRHLPSISPDARRLAYLAPENGVMNLFAGEIGADPRCLTSERERPIRQYRWAPNSRHLLYLQDSGGDENYHVFSVDLVSGDVRDCTPFPGVMAQVVGADRSHPNEILIAMNRDNAALHDIYKLELATGELRLHEKNTGFILMRADCNLEVRAAARMHESGDVEVFGRQDVASGWRSLVTVPLEDISSIEVPVVFSRDGGSVFTISAVGANAGRLVRMDLASGTTHVIYEDSEFDVTELSFHPQTGEPQLVGVLRDRLEYTAIDPALQADLDFLATVSPGELRLLTRGDDDSTWLVSFASDCAATAYYLYRRETPAAELLFNDRPLLERYTLAEREPFSFTSRDGLAIHGYLAFPPRIARSNLPTVFWVHGGPWGRDTWGFDPFAQLFANRGYLCVQVNYRGSTGYGKRFMGAGDREWGGRMQDDLIDCVEWVAEQGFADRSRIAITGGSYGGYATLVGLTFTPAVFCCGIDLVGPSNLNTMINGVPAYWGPFLSLWKRRVGDPDTEADFLWSRSPLSRVDQIRAPLLIVHGENDPRVKKAESDQIVEAMEQRGIPHEYIVVADEGHGFARPENWIRFAQRMERFLAEHVGGRQEGPPQ